MVSGNLYDILHSFFQKSELFKSSFIWSYLVFLLYMDNWKVSFNAQHNWGFSAGSVVKSSPAMQETWVWSLGQEDPLEKETATHSSILAWEIPWREEPGGL